MGHGTEVDRINRVLLGGLTRRAVLARGGALGAAALAVPGLAGAGRSSARAAQAPVTIRVTDAPAEEAVQEEKDFYAEVVERFQQAHPNVTIDPSAGGYGGPDVFAAKVAGGTVEDAFAVWFTEPQRYIRQGIAADITDQIRTWEHFASYVPEVLQVFSNAEGRVYGIPTSAYALSLVYNRSLFEEAGLDPNAPPATWDDLRTAAKQIADETGTPGFAFLSTQNTGGWHFTTMLYTFGADPVERQGDRLVATVNGEAGVRVLQLLKEMRWTDGSMTEEQQLTPDLVGELLATNQVAMAISGVPTNLVEQYEADINNYGLGIVPQGGGNAVLGGGYGWMFNAESSPEQIQAGIDWVLFRYFDPASFEADLESQVAREASVGFPEPGIFTGPLQQERDAVRAEKANVPTELYQPYVEGMKGIAVRPEPTGFDVQRFYAALDPAVQAVLTDENADPQALLDEANARIQTEVLDQA